MDIGKISISYAKILDLKHKNLTPQLVFIARVLAIFTLCAMQWPFRLHTPLFDIMYTIPTKAFSIITKAIWLLGLCTIIFTKHIRFGAALVGLSLLLGLLASKNQTSVAHTYLTALYIVIALSNKHTGNMLLILQLSLLYTAAFIHKAIDADWWNGNYMHILFTKYNFPKIGFPKIYGIVVILIQALLGVGIWYTPWWKYLLIIALLFHTTMILMLNEYFGPFYFAIVASWVVVTNFPVNISNANNQLTKSITRLLHNPLYYYLLAASVIIVHPLYLAIWVAVQAIVVIMLHTKKLNKKLKAES